MSPSRPAVAHHGEKQEWRQQTWDAMRDAKVVGFPGAQGRIPNFVGAGEAAARLATMRQWQGAATVKANPDMPQLPVRARALDDGKLVYMAVPRLRRLEPFDVLDPDRLEADGITARAAASIKGAETAGRPVTIEDMPHIDLIVCGTVVVDRRGVRLGKGGGYSDLELALGVEHGIVDDDTFIVTTVHPLQVVDDELPETSHDFRVDAIVTPHDVIRCRRTKRSRPAGIVWDDLDEDKIASIPVLAARRRG